MCNYCLNAYVCDELYHDNDLSFMSVGESYNGRLEIMSGAGRGVVIQFESKDRNAAARYKPKYCPECGRKIAENEV